VEACALIGDGDYILFVLPELCGVQICPQVDYRLHRFWINRVKAVGSGAVHNDSFSVFQINCVQGIGVGGAVVYFLGFIGKGSGYFFHQCGFSTACRAFQEIDSVVRVAQQLLDRCHKAAWGR
jgi:hypothetical protein